MRRANLDHGATQAVLSAERYGNRDRGQHRRRLEEENINVGLRRFSNLSDDLGVGRGGNRMVRTESLVKITESGKLHDYITRKRRKPRT